MKKEKDMNHKKIKEWLSLWMYNELNAGEKSVLKKHLEKCRECRSELARMKNLHAVLEQRRRVAVSDSVLRDARRTLRLRLYDEAATGSIWKKMRASIDGIMTPVLQAAFAGTAVLAAGILIGYFVFRSPDERFTGLQQAFKSASIMEAGEPKVENIRFVDRDMQSGMVEFTFETSTPMHVRGNINDDNVQRVLARALLNEQNTGTRIKTVNMIGLQSEQGNSSSLDSEVKSALITALLKDKNIGVRKVALDVLKNYLPDQTIVRAFLTVLANEKNAGLKIAAINSLDITQYGNQTVKNEIIDMLKKKAKSDDNNYIKIKAKTALQEIKQ
jgi:hypothetical protein